MPRIANQDRFKDSWAKSDPAFRQKAYEDLFFFCKYVLGYKDLTVQFHKPICDLLTDRAEKRDVAIVVARGHFKSTIAAIAYPIWRAIHDPNWTCLIASCTSEIAESKVREIRRHFERTARLRETFPEIIPTFTKTEWSDSHASVQRTTTSGQPTFTAAGAGMNLTGTHPDEIIEDDLVAPDRDDLGREYPEPDVQSIRMAINWHKYARAFIKDPKTGRVTSLGTRWCREDYLSYLEDKEGRLFSFHYMPAIDDKGNPTFPERFSKGALDQLRLSMGEFIFASQYLLNPMEAKDLVFRAEDFMFYDATPPRESMEIWAAVDPAATQNTRSHPSAICVLGVDTQGKRYVLDYMRGKVSFEDLVNTIFEINARWRPDHWLFEAVAAQVWLINTVKKAQHEAGRSSLSDITAVTRGPREHQEGRIKAIVREFTAHAVYLPRKAKGQCVLQYELLNFPRIAGNDVADALATCMQYVWQPLPGMEVTTQTTNVPSWLSTDRILKGLGKKTAPMGFSQQLGDWQPEIFSERTRSN